VIHGTLSEPGEAFQSVAEQGMPISLLPATGPAPAIAWLRPRTAWRRYYYPIAKPSYLTWYFGAKMTMATTNPTMMPISSWFISPSQEIPSDSAAYLQVAGGRYY
jgi:hypothetical protein